jgi:hypothetical protein
MRAQFVNEKFRDDSDPIRDMGIGIRPMLTKEWAKLLEMTTNEIYLEYFVKIKFSTIASSIVAAYYFNLIKRLREEYIYEEKDFQKAFDEEFKNLVKSSPTGSEQDHNKIKKEAALIIKRNFGIKVKYK